MLVFLYYTPSLTTLYIFKCFGPTMVPLSENASYKRWTFLLAGKFNLLHGALLVEKIKKMRFYYALCVSSCLDVLETFDRSKKNST